MKIGIFVRCLHNGGTERVAARQSIMWQELGHEVVFLTLLPKRQGEFSHACVARETFGDQRLSVSVVQSYQRKYKFDLCVINGDFGSSNSKTIIEALGSDAHVKIIAIIHHSYSTWLYELACCEDFSMQAYLPKVDALVCVDPLLTLWWREMGARAIYIPNPVAIEHPNHSVLSESLDKDTLVWVGRLNDPCKCANKMIRIFERVVEKRPMARLKMVGDYSATTRSQLLRNLHPDVVKHIDLVGYVNNTTDVVSESALHVFTSEFEVTVPQVILEAQSLGVPTIALDMPALAPVSAHEGVIKVPDEQQFVSMVCDLLEDKDKRNQLASAAREFVPANRNAMVKHEWDLTFGALRGEGWGIYLDERVRLIASVENYRLILAEEQRAQRRFVNKHVPRLRRLNVLQTRIRRLMKIIGLQVSA